MVGIFPLFPFYLVHLRQADTVIDGALSCPRGNYRKECCIHPVNRNAYILHIFEYWLQAYSTEAGRNSFSKTSYKHTHDSVVISAGINFISTSSTSFGSTSYS
jgi:hypothetical protein